MGLSVVNFFSALITYCSPLELISPQSTCFPYILSSFATAHRHLRLLVPLAHLRKSSIMFQEYRVGEPTRDHIFSLWVWGLLSLSLSHRWVCMWSCERLLKEIIIKLQSLSNKIDRGSFLSPLVIKLGKFAADKLGWFINVPTNTTQHTCRYIFMIISETLHIYNPFSFVYRITGNLIKKWVF